MFKWEKQWNLRHQTVIGVTRALFVLSKNVVDNDLTCTVQIINKGEIIMAGHGDGQCIVNGYICVCKRHRGNRNAGASNVTDATCACVVCHTGEVR